MKPDNRKDQSNNAEEKRTFAVSGNLSVELKNSGIDNVVKAIKKETATEQQTENRSNVIQFRQLQQQRRANNIAVTANLIGLIMFAATVCVFVLSIKAISAANKSATIAENTFSELKKELVLNNLPVVVVDTIGVSKLIPNKPIYISIRLKNFGKSGAFVRKIFSEIIASTFDTMPIFPYSQSRTRSINLYIPVSEKSLQYVDILDSLNQGQIDGITNGSSKYFIYGQVTYEGVVSKDIFYSKFSFRILPNGNVMATDNHNGLFPDPDNLVSP